MIWLLSIASCYTPIPIEPHYPLPSAPQKQYHDEELAALMHWGMNTCIRKEVGTGEESPEEFNMTGMNSDHWIKVLKDCGFKKVIITAKHHDGFCNWPTKFTNHSVDHSPKWIEAMKKQGRSNDVILELSKSCTKHNFSMGIYISPWDRHSKLYGNETNFWEPHNLYILNQLRELLGDRRYGNNGKINEIWFDGAKFIAPFLTQPYYYQRWIDYIEALQPGCLIMSRYASGIRTLSNENGVNGYPSYQNTNKTYEREMTDANFFDRSIDFPKEYYFNGDRYGDTWSTGEADYEISNGWFWAENRPSRGVKNLCDTYFKNVGLGVPFLLNVPPDDKGELQADYVQTLYEFKETIDQSFARNFIADEGVKIVAKSGYNNESTLYKVESMLKSDDEFWAPDDGCLTCVIDVKFPQAVEANCFVLREAIHLGQRVIHFKLDYYDEKGELKCVTSLGLTIGAKMTFRMKKALVTGMRFEITEAEAPPAIREIGIYRLVGAMSLDNEPFVTPKPTPTGVPDPSQSPVATQSSPPSQSSTPWPDPTQSATGAPPPTPIVITENSNDHPIHGINNTVLVVCLSLISVVLIAVVIGLFITMRRSRRDQQILTTLN